MVEHIALGAALGALLTLLLHPKHPSQKDLEEAYSRTKKVAEEAKEALEILKATEQRILKRIANMSEEERNKILSSVPDSV